VAGIEELVAAGDVDGTLAACVALTESERRRLAKAAVARVRETFGSIQWERRRTQRDIDRLTAAGLFAFATASPSALRKLGGLGMLDRQHAATVARARTTEWRNGWVEAVLDEDWAPWALIRELVRDGLCDPPEGDGYALGMIYGLDRAGDRDPSLRDLLLADRGLLDDEVWRLFRVEGGGERSLAAHDKYARPDRQWAVAFCELAAAGVVDRDRLLDESLEALGRDFAPFRAGWFSRFHEQLSPTVDERAARVPRYLHLAASSAPATVGFAVKALVTVERARKDLGVDPGDAVRSLHPAVMAKAASTAKAAMALAGRVGGPSPEPLTQLALDALTHPSRDVQAAALALLDRLAPDLSGVDIEELREGLHPSLRVPAPTPSAPAAAAPVVELPVVRLGPLTASRLDAGRRLVPVTRADLLERLAAALDGAFDTDEYELVLAGIAAQCDTVPAGSSGVARRAARLVPNHLATVAVAWLEGTPPPRAGDATDVRQFLSRRAHAVARDAAARRPRLLLATPTHRGGFLEPTELVRRCAGRPHDELVSDRLDCVQALLRLAPGRREEALAAAGACPGEFGDALRYALGGPAPATTGRRLFSRRSEARTPSLWLAAARARRPDGADDLVGALGVHGPDGDLPAAYGLGTQERWPTVVVRSTPALNRTDIEWPTVGLHARDDLVASDSQAGALVAGLSSVWPLRRESYYALGVSQLGGNVDWWQAQWDDRRFLEPLLDPDEPVGEMAIHLITVALGSAEAGQRRIAVDVAAQAVADRRLDGPAVGAGLASWLRRGVLKPGRVVTSLGDIAAVSALHAVEALRAVEVVVATAEVPARQAAGVLDLMLRLVHEVGVPPADDRARRYLAGVTGSGKAAGLARQLLAAAPAPTAHLREATRTAEAAIARRSAPAE
jgi:hypothetical protein